jgi:hypothetical protein
MFWSWRRLLYPPYELTVAAGLLFSIYVFFIIPPSNQTHHFTYFHSHSLFILLVSVLLYSTGLGVQQSAGHINHSLQKIDFTPPLSPTHHTFYPCCKKTTPTTVPRLLQLRLVFFHYSSLFHYRWLGFSTSLLVSVLKIPYLKRFLVVCFYWTICKYAARRAGVKMNLDARSCAFT